MKKTVIRRGEMPSHRRQNMRFVGIAVVLTLGIVSKAASEQLSYQPPAPPELHWVDEPTPPPPAVKKAKAAAAEIVSGFSSKKEERWLLALTMWGEARGYGRLGMRSVGHVVMNRVAAKRRMFGIGVKGVIWHSAQFSCWYDDNREQMRRIHLLPAEHPDRIAWNTALKLADDILSKRDRDNTSNAIYYHTEAVKPYWRTNLKVVGVMFGHIFYKEKRSHRRTPRLG